MNAIVVFLCGLAAALATWIAVSGAARAAKIDPGPVPIVILILGAAIGTVAARGQASTDGFSLAATIGGVTSCAIGDARTGYLFDRATIVLGLVLIGIFVPNGHALSALGSGAIVAAPLAALFVLTRGAGIGLGDVKLAVPIGIGLGSIGGLSALGFAFVSGAIIGIVLLTHGRSRAHAVRFGPFLAVGTAASALAPIAAVIR